MGVLKMTEVLHRYRIIILVLSLAMLFTIAWLIFSKQNAHKIPSRGVFVISRMNTY